MTAAHVLVAAFCLSSGPIDRRAEAKQALPAGRTRTRRERNGCYWYERRLLRPPRRARRAIEDPASGSSAPKAEHKTRIAEHTGHPGAPRCAWALLCIDTDQFGTRGASLGPPEHPKPRERWHCSEGQIAAGTGLAPPLGHITAWRVPHPASDSPESHPLLPAGHAPAAPPPRRRNPTP